MFKKASIVTLASALFLYFCYAMYQSISSFPDEPTLSHKYVTMDIDGKTISFNLLDPQLAPKDIKEEVLYGFRLFCETPKLLPKNGNALDCSNCHIAGGNTLGGKNGGLSLVGVSTVYPQFSKRDNKVISLKDRINNCFKRSLNGKPLDEDSKEMKALVKYLEFISCEVAKYKIKNIPWLGVTPLKSEHTPDPANGKILYDRNCATCHRRNGEGGPLIPPLWGDRSFNDGAGMNVLGKISGFIYYNMPYQEPNLTEEEALDIASFVIEQPRPRFIKTP
ncbi:MAG: hypothetical protein BGO10_00880 [Chlamydia sp. 32-24]|nr:MAG: hypothetical protein BGO10_00880 [Chlamydia sp. 32-24]